MSISFNQHCLFCKNVSGTNSQKNCTSALVLLWKISNINPVLRTLLDFEFVDNVHYMWHSTGVWLFGQVTDAEAYVYFTYIPE